MDTILGIVGLAVFIVCVIGLSSLVTAAVVRLSPTKDKNPQKAA